jgi:hypothetical protein
VAKDYSNKNLQKVSFKGQNLSNDSFANSDLRGVDFSGADLTGADLTHVKTGITPLNTILIFIGALIVSLISVYFAMLAGRTVDEMLASKEPNVRTIGIITIIITILFLLYAWRRGTGKAIKNLIIPFALLAAVAGIIVTVSRMGTGYGILEQLLALMFVLVMFIVGTIARATSEHFICYPFCNSCNSRECFWQKHRSRYWCDYYGACLCTSEQKGIEWCQRIRFVEEDCFLCN